MKFTKYLSSHMLDILSSTEGSKLKKIPFLSWRGEPSNREILKEVKVKLFSIMIYTLKVFFCLRVVLQHHF